MGSATRFALCSIGHLLHTVPMQHTPCRLMTDSAVYFQAKKACPTFLQPKHAIRSGFLQAHSTH